MFVSSCVCYVCTSNVVNVGVLNMSSKVRPHGNVGLYRGLLYYRSTNHENFSEENERGIH